jgi:hypothetical protein
MIRLAAVLLAGAVLALPGCTLGDVEKTPPSASKSTPGAPKGWRQTGTMVVNGQVVPVYSEDYRGEGQSPYQRALNPASGRIEAFGHDEVGNVIWKADPMEPSGQ